MFDSKIKQINEMDITCSTCLVVLQQLNFKVFITWKSRFLRINQYFILLIKPLLSNHGKLIQKLIIYRYFQDSALTIKQLKPVYQIGLAMYTYRKVINRKSNRSFMS